MSLVPLLVFARPAPEGCSAAAVRHAQLVLSEVPCPWGTWLGLCCCGYDGDAVRLSIAKEWAEIFRLRRDRWPTDGDEFADGLTNRWGHHYLVGAAPDGSFELVDPGADGALGSRCGYAEEADLHSSVLR